MTTKKHSEAHDRGRAFLQSRLSKNDRFRMVSTCRDWVQYSTRILSWCRHLRRTYVLPSLEREVQGAGYPRWNNKRMIRYVYDSVDNKFIRVEDATPVCGEDFCDNCGDCLACFGDDDKCICGCEWVIYESNNPEKLTVKNNETWLQLTP